VRFLIDAQLPPALARLLAERGHGADHVRDIGLLSASDTEIWTYALEHQAALVTKDDDFADRVILGGPGPVVVWVRVGNTTRRALLGWFAPMIDQLITLIDDGERLIELR